MATVNERWRRRHYVEYVGENYSYGTPTSANGKLHSYPRTLEVVRDEPTLWNLWRSVRNGKIRGDLGGEFDLIRRTVSGPLDVQLLRSYDALGRVANEYKTVVVPSSAVQGALTGHSGPSTSTQARSLLIPSLPKRPSENTMDAVGAKFINVLNPTNPVVDLTTTVAEFMSERKFFALPGTAGGIEGEYLNYMFGIAPTIGALRDFRTASLTQEKVIEQYFRDSGRWVHRSATWDPERSTTKSVTSTYPVGLGPSLSTSVARLGTLTTTTRQYQKFWFSGVFTYHLPKEGMARKIAELDKLYGVDPSSAVGWELLPFSWLLDYKLSLGDSIQNLDSFAEHGIVMPYAYAMCHTRVEVEYTWQGELRDSGGSWKPVALSNTVLTESKQRRRANPFGFGITPGSLSPQQWSILAALGISLVR